MRKQRPRGSITREAVVNAALAVADRDGVDALTIRSVARAVGAAPMSLYTHFANKSELLNLMYGALAIRMYEDSGQLTWQAELTAMCHRIRDLLHEHPRWAPLLSRPAPPLALGMRERVLKLLVEEGADPADALKALSSAALVSIGLSLVSLTFQQPDGESALDKRFEKLRAFVEAAQDKHVATQAAMRKLRRFDQRDIFTFTVRALIAGLELDLRLPRGRGSAGA